MTQLAYKSEDELMRKQKRKYIVNVLPVLLYKSLI
jgi:hypothetical protein